MLDNPFNGNNFQSIWLKHFRPARKDLSFESIKHIKFFKDKYFPLYVNIGKNISNGMYFEIDETKDDFKGKTFLIYDVPEYFNIKTEGFKQLKIKKARQYKGYAADLTNFKSFEDYFNYKFKSKSRYKYNRNIARLEACFNVKYEIYHGEIDKYTYDIAYTYLIDIIQRRFDSIGLDNNIVSKKDYYKELAYRMILNKEAVLVLIYNDSEPISISLGFLSDDIMFFAITTFNIDYYRFNLGHITIMKLLEWCFERNLKMFDFSKGKYDYKDRWSNLEYSFHCHIIYDSKSIKSSIIAYFISLVFNFKQNLRDRKINYLFSKVKFILKGSKNSNQTLKNFVVKETQELFNKNEVEEIDWLNSEYEFLKAPLFDYLYGNPEKIDKIKIYKNKNNPDLFYVKGDVVNLKIVSS